MKVSFANLPCKIIYKDFKLKKKAKVLLEKISHEVFTEIAWGTWGLSALTVYLQFGNLSFEEYYFVKKNRVEEGHVFFTAYFVQKKVAVQMSELNDSS